MVQVIRKVVCEVNKNDVQDFITEIIAECTHHVNVFKYKDGYFLDVVNMDETIEGTYFMKQTAYDKFVDMLMLWNALDMDMEDLL
jgi:hypothetical protein